MSEPATPPPAGRVIELTPTEIDELTVVTENADGITLAFLSAISNNALLTNFSVIINAVNTKDHAELLSVSPVDWDGDKFADTLHAFYHKDSSEIGKALYVKTKEGITALNFMSKQTAVRILEGLDYITVDDLCHKQIAESDKEKIQYIRSRFKQPYDRDEHMQRIIAGRRKEGR